MNQLTLLTRSLTFSLIVSLLAACNTDTEAQAALETGAVQHPNLVLTSADVIDMKAHLHEFPSFYRNYLATKTAVDAQMQQPIVVPVPKDAGGGYTHEQHKANYKTIHDAGVLYQLSGEPAYAAFARDILLEYAQLFPTLGRHPVVRSPSPGRLFWQSLNEAVWLLYSIQGYDAIIDTLSDAERENIENNLFVPIATFLSEGQPGTFDRIHNHGTWANAAVGMTGYVLGNEEFVQQALYGLDKSGEFGFVKQLDEMFSPDGYYNEGPYYQRYALMPFVIFAQSIQSNDPEMAIFEYRDQILLKAIYGAIQLSYEQLFFPLNDAIKDKGLSTEELLYGVSIAYGITGDPALLSVSRTQGDVVLSGAGMALARGLAQQMDEPFPFQSMQFSDGAMGDRGALAILRSGSEPGHQAIVMKNTSQGLGHGHFDKLSWLFYANGDEIVQDYGAARFLNIEPKEGGHYLPENETWAKQTIAHNTLVVDQTSHFDGDPDLAETRWPTTLQFDVTDSIELVSAQMQGAYADVDFVRTLALIKDPDLEFPFVLDILNAHGEQAHQFDLPVHYNGHLINANFPMTANTERMETLGGANGYQHLWLKAAANFDAPALAQVTWLTGNRFYTLSSISSQDQQILFTELGANDPNFNLRRENAVIQRISNSAEHTFVSVLETHGEYNGTLEFTRDPYSSISRVQLVEQDDIDFVLVETSHGKRWGLGISYDPQTSNSHSISYQGRAYEWQGYYKLFEL